jgi:hypothetical protein
MGRPFLNPRYVEHCWILYPFDVHVHYDPIQSNRIQWSSDPKSMDYTCPVPDLVGIETGHWVDQSMHRTLVFVKFLRPTGACFWENEKSRIMKLRTIRSGNRTPTPSHRKVHCEHKNFCDALREHRHHQVQYPMPCALPPHGMDNEGPKNKSSLGLYFLQNYSAVPPHHARAECAILN